MNYKLSSLQGCATYEFRDIHVCPSQTQNTIWQNRDFDPRFGERRTVKIKLLPSAFKPFFQ